MSQIVDAVAGGEEQSRGQLRCRAKGAMGDWLEASGGSLAITTYTAGKVVLVGSHDGRMRFRARRFARPMGLCVEDDRLAVAVRGKLLLFRRRSSAGEADFILKQEFATGRVDAHDVAMGRRGIYFANTRFNCVARVSQRQSFVHCWQPRFLSEVVKSDRCHLNGLGMRHGAPAMTTAFCATNHDGGWREQNRMESGVLIDMANDRIVASGLCMPHSPRWHAGSWWLCNSGHGALVRFDSASDRCDEFCALPGFARGLALVGNHALVGLSRIRRKHVLDAPPVRSRHRQLVAGVALVDLRSAKMVGILEFVRGGNEVYEVAFLPRIKAPNLIRSPAKP